MGFERIAPQSGELEKTGERSRPVGRLTPIGQSLSSIRRQIHDSLSCIGGSWLLTINSVAPRGFPRFHQEFVRCLGFS
jgi:hypothetical protein